MKAYLSRLTLRERLLILIGLPLALMVAAYQFLWVPLSLARADYASQIAAYRLVTETAATAQTTPIAPVSRQLNDPISVRVTQSAEAAGLVLRRIEPDGAAVRVTLDDADFTQLLLWITELEYAQSVKVNAIEIDRRTAPGTVSARATLEDL
jgi:general secretion pathway protein M